MVKSKQKEITLILGAGCSMEYGFPSGQKLIEAIYCSFLNDQYPKFLSYVRNKFNNRMVEGFVNKIRYTPVNSIDGFLENHRTDANFVNLGKLCIALCINQCENEPSLFQRTYTDTSSNKVKDFNSWYAYLFNKICNLAQKRFDKLLEVPVNIITFNYDRSFEQFFYRSLIYSFDKSEQDCADLSNNYFAKRVIHVHGSLGSIFNYPYHPKHNNISLLAKMATNIRVIHENNDGAVLSDIKKTIKRSDLIYFVGFGYDPQNIRKLSIPRVQVTRNTGIFLNGSRYGIKYNELKTIKTFFSSNYGYDFNFFEKEVRQGVFDWDMTAYDFIRNCVAF